jgi:hypothetical protein
MQLCGAHFNLSAGRTATATFEQRKATFSDLSLKEHTFQKNVK